MNEGLTEAQQEAVGAHAWIVEMLAKSIVVKRYAPVSLEDLQQEGHLALASVIRRYDRQRGGFKQYAMYRVLGAMLDAIRTAMPAARIAVSAHKAVSFYCRHVRDEFNLMLHTKDDVRGFFDDFGDGLLVAHFEGWIEAAMDESAEDPVEGREDYVRAIEALRAARAALSEEDQKLLSLLVHDDCTQEEAGSRLNIAVSTVYRRYKQVLSMLRFALERYDVTRAPRPRDVPS